MTTSARHPTVTFNMLIMQEMYFFLKKEYYFCKCFFLELEKLKFFENISKQFVESSIFCQKKQQSIKSKKFYKIEKNMLIVKQKTNYQNSN